MSVITQLLCNNFGGIREKNAMFTSEKITAQDLQNVELYHTGVNNGVGIRTTKGNIKITTRFNNVNLSVYEYDTSSFEMTSVATNGRIFDDSLNFEIETTSYEDFARDSESDIELDDVQYYAWTLNSDTYYTITDGTDIIDLLPANETVIELFESIQCNNKYLFVYTEDDTHGKFYHFDIETKTMTLHKNLTGKTGLANGLDVAQGYSDLFFFTNGEEMFTIEMNHLDENELPDGVDVVDIDTVGRYENEKVKGILCAVFNNRLFISNGTVLWWSVTSNIYDFSTDESDWITSAGYLLPAKPITAIHEYLGSLAVFHRDSSALLSVSDGDFSMSDESPAGCASYNSLVFHDTNLYFYDDTKKAVFSFQEIVNGEKVLGQNVAIDIQDILLTIDSANVDKIRALSVFLEGRNEIWWLIPIDNDTSNYSIVLIFDYLKGEWVKRKCQKINCFSLYNNLLYSGGQKIYEEYASNTFDGEYIQHYYKFSPLNMGAMNTLKVLAFPPRVALDMPYANQFYVKYVKNQNYFKKPKIKLVKTKLKNFLYWGVGFWNVNFWAGKNPNFIGKFPSATFKLLEIEIYTQNLSQEFSIKNIEFSKVKVKQV